MGASVILEKSHLYEKGLLGTRVGCLMFLHYMESSDGDCFEIFNVNCLMR